MKFGCRVVVVRAEKSMETCEGGRVRLRTVGVKVLSGESSNLKVLPSRHITQFETNAGCCACFDEKAHCRVSSQGTN